MASGVIVLLSASACMPADSLFFRPRQPVDGYDFDGTDPDLNGHLAPAHPSIVGPEDRIEGFLETEYGLIHWVFAHRPGAREVILYHHGNAIHLGRYWDRVERLWSLGFHVMIYDYPGYGLSTGTPSEESLLASGRAIREHLETLPEAAGARVFLYGYSLGGVPALDLAARGDHGEGPRAAGVITESTFCSIEEVLHDSTSVGLPGHFATGLVMDNCATAAALDKTPLLVLHGVEDRTVLVRHATLLTEAASRVQTRLHRVNDAGHRDLPRAAGTRYDEWIRAFIGP